MPGKELGMAEFREKDGKMEWQRESTGTALSSELLPDAKELVGKMKKEAGEETLEQMAYTYSFLYRTTIVYFRTDKTEYIIPFTPEGELAGLKNGEVYDVKKAMRNIYWTYDENRLLEPEIAWSMGGIPLRFPELDVYVRLGSFCLAVIGFAGACVFIFQKRKNTMKR